MEWGPLNGAPEEIPYLLSRLDEYGGPTSYPNYSVGWAVRRIDPGHLVHPDGPRRRQHGRHRRALAQGHRRQGEIRRQYASVIDVVPTILEAVGIPEPKIVNGAEQTPMAGVSAWRTPSTTPTHRNGTRPSTTRSPATAASTTTAGWPRSSTAAPWEPAPRGVGFDQDRWELYHMAEDFGLAHDLADQHPEKLEEMKALFHAGGHQVRRLPARRPRLRAAQPRRGRAAPT